MQTLKNVRLYKMIEETINKFKWYCAGLEKGDPSNQGRHLPFNNDEVEIVDFAHFIEIGYGIVFKKTGDFGVYSCFVSDDGESRGAYYRSDAQFKNREFLGSE